MQIRLKAIFLLLVMLVGLSSGTPLSFASASGSGMNCVMKCCKKKVEKREDSHHDGSKTFCRLSNCFEIIPGAPSNSSKGPSFDSQTVEVLERIETTPFVDQEQVSFQESAEWKPFFPNAPPKFLLNKSLLL